MILICKLSLPAERKKGLHGALEEGQKFDASLTETLQWLADMQDKLDSEEPVSGNVDELRQQAISHDVRVISEQIQIQLYL